MARMGWEGHGLTFVRELAEQQASKLEATALTVGDAIGMDERESANVMGWLTEHWLVREAGTDDDAFCDPFTTGPLELTERGRSFVETGVLPPKRRIDTVTGLDKLADWKGRPPR